MVPAWESGFDAGGQGPLPIHKICPIKKTGASRGSACFGIHDGMDYRFISTRAPRIIPAAPSWRRLSRSRNRKKLAALITKITPTL